VRSLIGSLALVLVTLVCDRPQWNLAAASFLYLIVVVLLSLTVSLLHRSLFPSWPSDSHFSWTNQSGTSDHLTTEGGASHFLAPGNRDVSHAAGILRQLI
jgi:hypothetical protein